MQQRRTRLHPVSTDIAPPMKLAPVLGLVMPLLWSAPSAAADGPAGRPLDLRVEQADIPAGGWGTAAPDTALPDLGEAAPHSGSAGGGFRSDLPYGAGYEARQGRGHGSGQGWGGGGFGRGSGMGSGGRGMGGGRGR